MITLGTGVGSGIVINGQMVYGHDGFAGELGHVIIRRENGGVLFADADVTAVWKLTVRLPCCSIFTREFLTARTEPSCSLYPC